MFLHFYQPGSTLPCVQSEVRVQHLSLSFKPLLLSKRKHVVWSLVPFLPIGHLLVNGLTVGFVICVPNWGNHFFRVGFL